MSEDNLIEDKHPTRSLFVCDAHDAFLKDIMPQLEHPFYSLSKKPETKIRKYRYGDKWVDIIPSVKGMATIYDKDILIYAISQIVSGMESGKPVSRRVEMCAHDILVFTNRGTSGKDYSSLCDAIDRLAGTRISTNIVAGDTEEYLNFGLIEQGRIVRKGGPDGRLQSMEIVLSEWVFDAVMKKSVLTLNRDYFRIRKPIERRIYEIARKHCGRQPSWEIGIDKLHKKVGALSTLRLFKSRFKKIVEKNQLPDYYMAFDNQTNKVSFFIRDSWWEDKESYIPSVKNSKTYGIAKALIPKSSSLDAFAVEVEWVKDWRAKGEPEIENEDLSYINFVSEYFGVDEYDN